MFCSACGAEAAPGSAYCAKCGAALPRPAAPAPPAPAPAPPASTPQQVTGIPGTGAYEGMTWDGKRWVGAEQPPAAPPATWPLASQSPPPTTVPQLRNGKGIASLVLGILSVVTCGGGILAVIATVLGRQGMTLADQGLANNRAVAKAGFILGLVGLGISALLLLVLALDFVSSSV